MTAPNIDGKESVDRGPSGRFIKGNKASPGRPPGRGVVADLRDKLSHDVDKVIEVLRDQAIAGDPQSIRILLDKVLPSLRPIEISTPLSLPDGSFTDQGRAVLAAIASGDLAPGQGSQLLAAIGTLSKVSEIDELTKRVSQLEKKYGLT